MMQINQYYEHLLMGGAKFQLIMTINLTLNMDNFAGEGDVNLFGEMLHRFFALYADIHLFNQLTLVLQPTGKRLRWRENYSQHVPG
ncbi:hypothetical protein R515_23460 [Salmonella enterica subsp. arizonae serovar 41:z4,z23:-]|nr:hypothetical protein R515_23460 [Salmonella enterica subsp. arizonae serovar 41:z4,z23:-]SUG21248.1 Uncharacterized protein conserved in bacteria [Salmonella enterica subsp. arizonae]